MVATDLSEYFGRDRVFQLAANDDRRADFYTRATVLFDDSARHDELLSRIKAGAEITVSRSAGGREGWKGRRRRQRPRCRCSYTHLGKDLRVLTAGDTPDLMTGQELMSLIERQRPLPGDRS